MLSISFVQRASKSAQPGSVPNKFCKIPLELDSVQARVVNLFSQHSALFDNQHDTLCENQLSPHTCSSQTTYQAASLCATTTTSSMQSVSPAVSRAVMQGLLLSKQVLSRSSWWCCIALHAASVAVVCSSCWTVLCSPACLFAPAILDNTSSQLPAYAASLYPAPA